MLRARGVVLGVGLCAVLGSSASAQTRSAPPTATPANAGSMATPTAAGSATPAASAAPAAAPSGTSSSAKNPKGAAAGSQAMPPPPPPAAPLPEEKQTSLSDQPAQSISLDDALKTFHSRGFDLLLADAQVRAAEADVKSAGYVPNPALSLTYGRIVDPDYSPSGGASANSYTVGLTDQAAIMDTLVGKRGLRKDVANAALAAARLSKLDAFRTLDFMVKQQYVTLAASQAALDFAKQVQIATTKTLDLQKLRYPKVINEGDLARFETTKLEADQGVDQAEQALQTARVQLAFLLGERTTTPAYVADVNMMKFRLPEKLASYSLSDLEHQAVTTRPDVLAQARQEERAQASIDLARRQRFPDIAISAQYTQTGSGSNNPVQPPMLSVGLSAPIPLLYQNQGEVAHAEADLYAQTVTRRKFEAQAINDVASGYAAFTVSRRLVERMESSLLDRAKRARDITELQYNAGSTSLIDFIDAERTFIATNFEYIQDVTAYWTAVYQLEQAVGTDLRK